MLGFFAPSFVPGHSRYNQYFNPPVKRYCTKLTADRVLLETQSRVFNIRPSVIMNRKINVYQAMDSANLLRFYESDYERKLIDIGSPEIGLNLEHLIFHGVYPIEQKQLEAAYHICTAKPSPLVHLRRLCIPMLTLSFNVGWPENIMALLAVLGLDYLTRDQDWVGKYQTIVHCDSCCLKQATIIPDPEKPDQTEFELDTKDLMAKIPTIANSLTWQTFGDRQVFSFISYISEDSNNSVALISNENGNKFIIKHIFGEAVDLCGEQSYPESFTIMQHIRQAALDRGILMGIGADLDVIPVVSRTKLISVPVKEDDREGLAFFKMVPYVENSMELIDFEKNPALTPERQRSIYKRIAQYLARLHTCEGDVRLLGHESCRGNFVLTASRVFGHPHFRNWLVDPSNRDRLYLVDWDLYSREKSMKKPCDIIFSEDDIYCFFRDLPDDYRNDSKNIYLEEWQSCSHILEKDKEKALSLLEKTIEGVINKLRGHNK